MKKLTSPSKILIFITIPQVLLDAYLIIGLLSHYSINIVYMLSISILINIMFSVYALKYLQETKRKKQFFITCAVAFALLIVASIFLLEDSLYIIRFISARLVAIFFSCLSVMYCVFVLSDMTQKKTHENYTRYIVALVALPLVWFFVFNILSGVNLGALVMILIVAGAYTAIFLLIKTLALHKSKVGNPEPLTKQVQKRKYIVLYAIFSLALPLIGLTINVSMSNEFGDFSHPMFFIVPVINGILLLKRPFEDRRLRLLHFFLISVATSYLIYFFIVFLPYIPLGFFGLIIVLGALIFAPAAALIMQIIYFIKEWPAVAKLWGAKRVLLTFVVGLLVLPVLVLTSFIGDKDNLMVAASYLEQNTNNMGEEVNFARLDRTLKNSRYAFEDNRSRFDVSLRNNTPIITDVYTSIVLEKNVVSKDNIENLDALFFNSGSTNTRTSTIETNRDQSVDLIEAKAETTYDEQIQAYRTWVHLTMQASSDSRNDEYVTQFYLPEGVYVSDYYLDVLGIRKEGILADERAALMVYQDIVRTPKDPGILHYISERQLELRVYPFSEYEKRQTGFEIIHNQDAVIMIDDYEIVLEAQTTQEEVIVDGAALISADLKDQLPSQSRETVSYYFIIDSSAHSDIDYHISSFKKYAAQNDIHKAKVIFASYNLAEYDLANIDKQNITPRCGFNLGLAVKHILSENGEDTVPIIIFSSDNPYGALFPQNVSLLTKAFPESSFYYQLKSDKTLVPFAYNSNEKSLAVDEPQIDRALNYNGILVKDDKKSEIVLTADMTTEFGTSSNQLKDAILLDILLRSNDRMISGQSLELLRASFESRILTPQTAFIVVETAQQENQLLDKQEKLMEQDRINAKESLDEPSLLICLFIILTLIVGIMAIRRKRKKDIYN